MEHNSNELSTEANFEDKLIEAVKAHDCLFNKGAISYRKKTMKNFAWSQVAAEVGSDVKDCQHRWRSLRDRFVREMKLQLTPSKPSTTKIDCKWKYLNKLTFLKDHSEPRKYSKSICQTTDEEETCSNSRLEYEIEEITSEACEPNDTTSYSSSPEPEPESEPDTKKRKQEPVEEITFVSFPPMSSNSTPTAKKYGIKKRKDDTPTEGNERLIKTTAPRNRNEDYYRTLDSYMCQLPEMVQDDLKIEILNRVYVELRK